MKKQQEPLTVEKVKAVHSARRAEIRRRLAEFRRIRKHGTESELWEEMVYCFFTGGCSAKMGLRAVEAVRPLLATGTEAELARALAGVHRYPNARSRYVVASRDHLRSAGAPGIRTRLESFRCPLERRDWLANDKGVKGLGYKEASHFLRNVGFRGYAILDKHVLGCLAELGVVPDAKPPATRSRYLAVEERLKGFSADIGIDFDEIDLVLWSIRTGEILK